MQPVATIPVGNALGECVLWDDVRQAVWWTDILARTLFRLQWRDRALIRIPLPERLASFAFIAERPELLAAFADGLALFDPENGTMSHVVRPEGLLPGQRLNDGRVDRQGRFWVGAMVEGPAPRPEARLYCLDQGCCATRVSGLAIANTLCFSPDGTWCYCADSAAGIIWRMPVDAATGAVGPRQELVRPSRGCPDGAAVDAEGYIWCALWGGSAVARYTPDGHLDWILEVPVTQPSCVAFGGPDLDHLFVTSAQTCLTAAQTGAGDLFVYNVGVRGLAESRFKFDGWLEDSGR